MWRGIDYCEYFTSNFYLPYLERSVLALNYGISIINTSDTIDTEYRSQIVNIMINFGHEPNQISKGDHVAQLPIRDFLSETTGGKC